LSKILLKYFIYITIMTGSSKTGQGDKIFFQPVGMSVDLLAGKSSTLAK